jgi:hypothetical protein
MEHLAERLGLSQLPPLPVEPDPLSQESLPLFVMMEPNGASSVPKMHINKKAIIGARKNATQ